MHLLQFPIERQRSLREKARQTISTTRVASIEARLRLMQMTRIFETPDERQRRQALERLRSLDHAEKRWLMRQKGNAQRKGAG